MPSTCTWMVSRVSLPSYGALARSIRSHRRTGGDLQTSQASFAFTLGLDRSLGLLAQEMPLQAMLPGQRGRRRLGDLLEPALGLVEPFLGFQAIPCPRV